MWPRSRRRRRLLAKRGPVFIRAREFLLQNPRLAYLIRQMWQLRFFSPKNRLQMKIQIFILYFHPTL